MTTSITVSINGEPREVESGATVAALLAELRVASTGIAVAKNDRVVPRSAFEDERIEAGDRIEIIKAVAGG